jgi:hypothetical protein
VRRYSPFVSAEAMHRLDYLNAAKEAFKRASQLMLSYQYQVLCAPGLRSPRGARLLWTAETETMRPGLPMPMRIAPTVHRLGKRTGLACLINGHCAGRHRGLGWVSGQTKATGDDQSQQQRSHCVLLSPRHMQGAAVTRSCYGWPVVRKSDWILPGALPTIGLVRAPTSGKSMPDNSRSSHHRNRPCARDELSVPQTLVARK